MINTFLLLTHVALRLFGAFYSPVHDCDETFNFLEPLHFLLFGHGLQTWEYFPEFAMRSWAYIGLHALPLLPFKTVLSPPALFKLLRIILSLACAIAEQTFARSFYMDKNVSPSVILCLLAFSPGMFSASSAFLPSSFALICLLYAYSFKSVAFTTFWIAASAIIGWPFSAAIGFTYALSRIFASAPKFVLISTTIGIILSAIVILIDSQFYGRAVFSAFNIVWYNVVLGKVQLYEVVEKSFYVANLALNWTPLGFVLGFLGAMSVLLHIPRSRMQVFCNGAFLTLCILMAQSHKEERFLYPLYPFMAIFIACGFHVMRSRFGLWSFPVQASLMIIYIVSSILRILALVSFFGAPLSLDTSVISGKNSTVCLDDSWHLSIGHFTYPSNVRLRFTKITGNTSLPMPFPEGLPLLLATSSGTHANFNDNNKLQEGAVIDHQHCEYIVGFKTHESHQKEVSCALQLDKKNNKIYKRILYSRMKPGSEDRNWQKYCIRQNSQAQNTTQKTLEN